MTHTHAKPSTGPLVPPNLPYGNGAAASPDFMQLTLQSTLAELPAHDFAVPLQTEGEEVAQVFQQRPYLPGVVITDDTKVVALISRRIFLEQIGRLYGVEIYLNRPIALMAETIGTDFLALPASTTISQAVAAALSRPGNQYYEPLIVVHPNGKSVILDSYILLLAQSRLLQLVNEVEQRQRQLAESLQRTGKALVNSLSLNKVTRRILKELQKVVAFERGMVLLYTEDTFISLARSGYPHIPRFDEVTLPLPADPAHYLRRLWDSAQPVVIPDTATEPTWQQDPQLPLHHSWLGVPLLANDTVIGLISVTRRQPDGFQNDDVTLVTTFAGQAAVALVNARLYEQTVDFNETLETQVKERTQALNQAYSILEKLDRTKSDFIKIAAHELRTPMAVVKGYAQLVQMHQKSGNHEKTAMLLDGIVKGVDRLVTIVNAMLDVARIDSNTLEVYQEAVSLAAVVERVLLHLEEPLQERDLTIAVADLGQLPLVYGDLELLKKVFFALLTNAAKYTPDGGYISVDGRTLIADNRAWVEVVVADTGVGIASDQQELIFQKFYQTGETRLHSSGTTSFQGGGPGLGLAVAYGVVQAHNGRIWVESPGHDPESLPGSRFYVRLPLINDGRHGTP